MSDPYPYHQIEYVNVSRPRWWLWYVIGSLMLVAAAIVPCVGSGLLAARALPRGGDEFTPPAKVTYTATERGPHVIWIDRKDDPKSVHTPLPTVPSDFQALVTASDGSEIKVGPPQGRASSATFGSRRAAAATFYTPTAGNYSVEIKTALPAGSAIAITQDRMVSEIQLGLAVILIFAIGALLGIGGLVLLIVTGVRHANYRG
jgi:hypothetical protein